MRVGIDTSGLLEAPRFGCGLNHLFELLRAGNPIESGISKVVVWAGKQTINYLSKLPKQPWLELIYESQLDGSLPSKLYWQRIKLPALAQQQCDCLFIPSGSYKVSFRPFVTISDQFVNSISKVSRLSPGKWFRGNQSLTNISQADGVIFFTDHARKSFNRAIPMKSYPQVIPRGIDSKFYLQTRTQKTLSAYSELKPFRFLYVSDICADNHQLEVIHAILKLRKDGYPVTLDLIGENESASYMKTIIRTLASMNSCTDVVRIIGQVQDPTPYYHKADAFVFASESKFLPIELLEAMASGLPIACSDYEPMPELLGEAGYYFNPTDSTEIAEALGILMGSLSLRERSASLSHIRSYNYSWERCAYETFSYLAQVASEKSRYTTLQNKEKHTQYTLQKMAGR